MAQVYELCFTVNFDVEGFETELMKQWAIHGVNADLNAIAHEIAGRFCRVVLPNKSNETFEEFID